MKTNVHFFSLFLLIFLCLANSSLSHAQGGRPGSRDRPMRMDRSGRPMYNSWERQEVNRRLRSQQPLPRRLDAKNLEQRSMQEVSQDGSSSLRSLPPLPPQPRVDPPLEPTMRAAGSSAIQNAPATPVSDTPVRPTVTPDAVGTETSQGSKP